MENVSYRDPARTPKCTQRPHEDRVSGGKGDDRVTSYDWCMAESVNAAVARVWLRGSEFS